MAVQFRYLVKRMYFAIYIEFAYAPGYKLGVLRTEIEDQDCFVHGAKIKRKPEFGSSFNCDIKNHLCKLSYLYCRINFNETGEIINSHLHTDEINLVLFVKSKKREKQIP